MRFLILYLAAMPVLAFAQGRTSIGRATNQPAFPLSEYTEMSVPSRANQNEWAKIKHTKVSWGSTDVRYDWDQPITLCENSKITLTAWRGEKVAAQAVASTGIDLKALNFKISNLKSNNGSVINSEQTWSGFVRNVMFDDNIKPCEKRNNHSERDSSLIGDPIDHITKAMDMKPQTTRAIWVRIDVPQTALPGVYTGNMTILAGDKILKNLIIEVRVLERVLPTADKWQFHLDLWQNPFAVARYYQTPLWSEEHFEALKPYAKMYQEAGGKVITTSIMYEPWGGQTEDTFETMVTWIKKADGKWMFDYTVFDMWVEFMMSQGVDKQIACYSMVPWKLSFRYMDQATNSFKTIETAPGDKAYADLWGTLLTDFAKHLKAKGWFERTCIAMDERPADVMQKAIEVIRNADKDFRISLAGGFHPELSDNLYDYSVILDENSDKEFSAEVLESRKNKGLKSTFYTCCTPPSPANGLMSPPAECEFLPLYALAQGLDGYLNWAMYSWNLEPLLDGRFRSWRAGDCFLVYPGGRTSIRHERFLYGVQLYEKILILRAEAKHTNNDKMILEMEAELSKFTIKNAVKKGFETTINKLHNSINKQ